MSEAYFQVCSVCGQELKVDLVLQKHCKLCDMEIENESKFCCEKCERTFKFMRHKEEKKYERPTMEKVDIN
jgi:hypothetical protein